jgi:hypothetical protein
VLKAPESQGVDGSFATLTNKHGHTEEPGQPWAKMLSHLKLNQAEAGQKKSH